MLTHAGEADVFFSKAQELMQRGEIELAIELYKKGLDIDPQNSEARIDYAAVLRDYGRMEEARAVYETGLTTDPQNPKLHVRLADVLQALGRPDEAQAHYRSAYDLAPNSEAGVDAYVNLLRMERLEQTAAEPTQATIEWSGPGRAPTSTTAPAPDVPAAELAQLRRRLEGDWCLQWIDVYVKRDGVCRSSIAAGDFVFVDPPQRVSFRFDTGNRLASATGLEEYEPLRFDGRKTQSVEVELADRSVVHTLNYTDGRYFEFHFNNRERACFQMTANRRGDEQKACASTYTFCQCESPPSQLSSLY